ncbi:MAG: hypothetical protein NTNFB02_02730 [Nitrospira sp.]
MMFFPKKHFVPILCAAVGLAMLSSCTSLSAQRKEESTASIKKIKNMDGEHTQAMTLGELRDEVQRFAYRFVTHVNEPLRIVGGTTSTANVRKIVQRMKFANTWSAVDIAIGPNPELNLIDMIVYVTLSRMLMEDYWVPTVFTEQGGILTKAFRDMEEDIWSVGARVLDREQREELRGVIVTWREHNPDVQMVTGVRFGNIAPQTSTSRLAEVQKPGGLLGQMQRANDAVDEVRVLSERLLFLVKAMLPLSQYQAEATLSDVLAEPAIEQMFSDLDRLTTSTERYATMLERLPGERNATLSQVSDIIAKERNNFLTGIVPHEERLQGVLTNLRETLVEANKLIASVESFTGKYVPAQDPSRVHALPPADQKPFDIKDYQDTVSGVTDTVREAQKLALVLEQILNSPGWKERMPELLNAIDVVGKQGTGLVDFSFRRAVILVGTSILMIFVLAFLLVRYALKRSAAIRAYQDVAVK